MNFGKSKAPEQKNTLKDTVLPCTTAEILSRPGPIAIIDFVEVCIEEAYQLRASDIHVCPTEFEVQLQYKLQQSR